MSSGNFETLFFKKAIPLVNNVTGYSTLTMFAVGSNGHLEGYNFHGYQSTCGYKDTSTVTTLLTQAFNSTIQTSINIQQIQTTNSINQLSTSINYIGKIFVSTIPMAQDFVSTYTGNISTTASKIITPTISLGSGLSDIINAGTHSVNVNLQYSLYTTASTNTFTWVSTLGVFNHLEDPAIVGLYANKGVAFTTRVGNSQYSHINTTLAFQQHPVGYRTQIPTNTSNFHFEICFNNTPNYDVFIQGQNNITLTLLPLLK